MPARAPDSRHGHALSGVSGRPRHTAHDRLESAHGGAIVHASTVRDATFARRGLGSPPAIGGTGQHEQRNSTVLLLRKSAAPTSLLVFPSPTGPARSPTTAA